MNDLTHGVLYWGDERGNVSALKFHGCQDMCFFSVGLLSVFLSPYTLLLRHYIFFNIQFYVAVIQLQYWHTFVSSLVENSQFHLNTRLSDSNVFTSSSISNIYVFKSHISVLYCLPTLANRRN